MADLAKVEAPVGSARRRSDNRDTLLPGRRATDTGKLEINAPIVGRNQSEAQRLASILGVAEDAGQAAIGLLEQGQARHREQDRAAGSLADASGNVDQEQLAKSRAYAQGYYTSGATRTVLELGTKAREAVNQRLFDENDPATIEDVNDTLNHLFASYALNEDGTPRNFGDPGAARIMAEGLARIRSEVLPQAAEHIRTQQNAKLADNVAFNLVNGGLPEVFTPGTAIAGQRVPQPGDVRTIEVPPSTVAAPAGLITSGNINLHSRPVVHNQDGSISTVRSISIEKDGKTVLIPTVVGGKVVSDQAAIRHFERTGEHLGIFDTEANATAYAKALHESQAAEYGGEARLTAPFAGFTGASPTDRIGSPRPGGRTHNGEDFAVPTGTRLVAPAAGRVVSTKSTSAGGQQVIVQLSNGDRVGFAHLSAVHVKEGDAITAGQELGATGTSGNATGPSVHMTVTVGGKKVSPSEYFKTATAATGEAPAGANEDPNLRDRVFHPAAEPAPPAVDFEAIMRQRPPSISPGEWKAAMVPAIIQHAEIAQQPELLEGLWRSKRADGTPSFNPEEIGKIRDAAERIRVDRRQKVERARRETWENNGNLVLGEILNGRDPADSTLVNMANKGEIDPQFAYSVIEHREAEARQNEREANADARQAHADAEREFDLDLATLQMERAAGLTTDSTYAEDLRRFQTGAFGTGKGAYRRFRQARAAAAEGLKRVQDSPEGQHYATMLDETFPRVNISSLNNQSLIARSMGPQSNITRTAALSYYVTQLQAGKSPSEAFEATTRQYKPGAGQDDAALRRRQAELQAKR